MTDRAGIDTVTAATYRFPTPHAEADGTLEWDATTAVVVHISAGGQTGLGWTYSTAATAAVVTGEFADVLRGRDPVNIDSSWSAMHRAARNLGTRGLVVHAISAVDVALWDLKGKLLGQSLLTLFGRCRDAVPVYGSGGFTTLNSDELAAQVENWRDLGCTAVKIKIGESWGHAEDRDLRRVHQLRELAGPDIALMVDANGAYGTGQALRVGHALDDLGIVWFEEPVSSDDLTGLDFVRRGVRCDVTAGEYANDAYDIQRLIPSLDCLQLDATRCGGYTGWLRGATLAAAHNREVSAHCAPALHAPVAASIANLRHVEYFADHARLEPLLLQGLPPVHEGAMYPSSSTPGHGMTLADSAHKYLT